MPTYRIDLAYDGSGFHGYARQPGLRTVQGSLEEALGRLVGEVDTTVAGRTDKGVHASGQVVSFATTDDIDVDRTLRSLQRQLAPDVGVLDLRQAADDFDARFDATSRRYRYLVLNREAPDPFIASRSWHYPTALDPEPMNAAGAMLLGEHDFASFCRAAPGRSTVRDLRAARWSRDGDVLAFDTTASSFCHQMVRSLVAFLVEVGRGRVDPGATAAVLAARDRQKAKGAAPAHGLTLVAVSYD